MRAQTIAPTLEDIKTSLHYSPSTEVTREHTRQSPGRTRDLLSTSSLILTLDQAMTEQGETTARVWSQTNSNFYPSKFKLNQFPLMYRCIAFNHHLKKKDVFKPVDLQKNPRREEVSLG